MANFIANKGFIFALSLLKPVSSCKRQRCLNTAWGGVGGKAPPGKWLHYQTPENLFEFFKASSGLGLW